MIARGVVLEMPQLPSSDSKGSSMAGTPAPEDPSLSVSLSDKDEKLEKDGALVPGTDEASKSVHDILFELVDSAVPNFSAGLSSPSTSLSLVSRNSLQAVQNTGASVCMYDHGLGALNVKPLKEVDPSQPFIEIRKNREACTSGDTCSTPDQLSFSGVESGFCGRFGYEETWNPPRTGDQVGHGPCSPSPETTSSSPSSKVMQDLWPRYQLQANSETDSTLLMLENSLIILLVVSDFSVHIVFPPLCV